MKKTNRQSGISLLAVMGILCAMCITLGALAPAFIKNLKIDFTKKAVQEMKLIQDSAKEYHYQHGSWPTTLQTLKDSGHLNPNWDCTDPWGQPFQVSSTATTFSVSSTGIPEETQAIASASLAFSNASGSRITSTIPLAGEEAAMQPMVRRSGDTARRTMTRILKTPGINTTTYYQNFTGGNMRIKDWYVEDMSSQEDGSDKGMFISEYPEKVIQSINP